MRNQRCDGSVTGGKILARGQVMLSAEPVAVILPGDQITTQPNVRLFRDGNIVRAIDVVCPCGETVRLHCEYPQTPVDDKDAPRN